MFSVISYLITSSPLLSVVVVVAIDVVVMTDVVAIFLNDFFVALLWYFVGIFATAQNT